MVRRAFRLVTGKISSLHQAAFWLAFFSILSQLLAFLRDHLLASYFGAGRSLDIYYAAFRVPDSIFITIGSLVSISVLVPMFSKKELVDENGIKSYLNSIFSSFLSLIVLASLAAFLFMPYLATFLFRGFDAAASQQIVLFSRILLLSPILLGLSNFFGSIVQYEKRFMLYSLSPLFYNFGIIAGTILGANNFGIVAVVLGVVFGALLHFLVPFLYVLFTGSLPNFSTKVNFVEVRETAMISVPRALALSFSQLIDIVFTGVASFFGVGSVAVFNLAWNLQSVPLSVIGASYSLAAFPTLSEFYAKKKFLECGNYIGESLRYIFFWTLPIATLFIILRTHIIRVVLGSGFFDWSDTKLTAAVISIFAISFVFQSAQLFLTRAHYALGRTRTPLLIGFVGVFVTIGSAFVLHLEKLSPIIFWLQKLLEIDGISGAQIIILPAAFSVGSLVTSFGLWFALDSETRLVAKNNGIYKSIFQTVVASVIIGLITFINLRLFDSWFALDSFWAVFGHAFVSGMIGIVAGAWFLKLINNREINELLIRFKGLYGKY